jgi:exodeoxyribonuclease VII large subunit
MNEWSSTNERRVYRVSELNAEIKGLLEARLGSIWVEGEISNFKLHTSGHVYFTLKDKDSQIRAVCFKGQMRMIRFRPEDGLSILAHGTITVYTPRGEYQILVDAMEPKGVGSLQLAFEQLKKRLNQEGLFDAARKRPLPMLPRRIGVVTSPTGAVIRDILHVLGRRNRGLDILLYPVRVQGEGASGEIAQAIACLGARTDIDVVLIGRGGGSIEDLWPFNEEIVARAIVACPVPVISAVGHETDFTIADFVADLRAPTPSAAAEMVSAVRDELIQTLRNDMLRMKRSLEQLLAVRRRRLEFLIHTRAFGIVPDRLRYWQQRLDEFSLRMLSAVRNRLALEKNRRYRLGLCLEQQNPYLQLAQHRSHLTLLKTRMQHSISSRKENESGRLTGLVGRLEALSPLAILGRGYAICRNDTGEILRSAAIVGPGDKVNIRLSQGCLECLVENSIGE